MDADGSADETPVLVSSRLGRVLATMAWTAGSVPRIRLLEADATDGDGGESDPAVQPGSSEIPAAPGDVELVGEIVRGGMGAVLKGRDPDLGRDLAVKVLLEARLNAARAAARAGCGREKDDPPPGETERAGLRKLALGWLRANPAARGRSMRATRR
jgi:hypothetical protein